MSGDTIPGFEVFDKISEGPVYSSFKARQVALDRWVVLSLLTPEFSADEQRSRVFLREAKKVARLKQPGILQVFDLGQENSQIFLVTEYVEGVSVDQLLKSIGKLPAAKALETVRVVSLAMEFAWVRASLIHGGLTPSRIIIEQSQPKIAGLGLSGLDAEQRGVGRDRHYLPPERVEGDRPASRDDIYALGIIWREMLTGLPTMPEEVRGPSPTAGKPPPGVPLSIWTIIQQMTTSDLEQRYAKWTDVVRDLKVVETGKGVEISPVIFEERPRAPDPIEKPPPPRSIPAKRIVVAAGTAGVPTPGNGSGPKNVPPGPKPTSSGNMGTGLAWGLVVLLWLGAGGLLWWVPGGRGLDFTVRDLPAPGVMIRPEPAPGSVSGGAPGSAPSDQAVAPATPSASVVKGPTPEDIQKQTERAILDMEDQVAAYLLREELENSVGALDIILEDSDNAVLRSSARKFKEFVAAVAELNTAVASAMRLKSGEEVTVIVRSKPIQGRLMAVSGDQIVIDETVDQKTTIVKRQHSINLADVDPGDRARWLGDGPGAVRKAMLFILAWRSRQPPELLSRLASQSGALANAFQRRVDSMPAAPAARSDAE